MNNIQKIIGIFLLFTVLSWLPLQASEYKVASPFVRITTNMLGYNFIAKKVAQSVLKKTLKKSLAGEYKVKFNSFSGVDLKKGKFKGLVIDGTNLSDKSISISKIHLETTSDFNYVDYKKEPIIFYTDIPLSYDIELTEADLNKSFINADIFETISAIIPLVKVEKPSVKIVNNKIKLQSSLKMPLAKPVKFSMSSALKVEDGKIVLSDVESTGSKDFANNLVSLVNKHSLLDSINLDIFENTDTEFSVQSVTIKNGKVYISGKIKINKTK